MSNSFQSITKQNIIAYLELTGAFLLAGSSVVAAKLLSNHLPVFLVSAASLVVALIILIPLIFWFEKPLPHVTGSMLTILFFQAFCGMFLFRIFILYGVKYTSALAGGIITSTTPAIICLFAFLLLHEHLALMKIAGIFVVILGILIINTIQPDLGKNSNPLLGNLLILGAVIGEALFSILSKKVAPAVGPLVRSAIICFLALVLFIPSAIWESLHFDFSSFTFTDGLAIFYYGAFITVAAYILWFKGIAKIPASTGAIFTGFMPLSSTVLSYFLLGEKLLLKHFAGLTLVILGVILATHAGSQTQDLDSCKKIRHRHSS